MKQKKFVPFFKQPPVVFWGTATFASPYFASHMETEGGGLIFRIISSVKQQCPL